jgi:general secretion pathway protein J
LHHTLGGSAGFTLIELTVALVLVALIGSVLYGSLSLAGDSWNRGEAKVQRVSEMRSTEDFLRRTLTTQHPLRFQKVADKPLYFLGTRDALSYAAALPGRAGGGMYYFKLAASGDGASGRLVLLRVIPDYGALALPDFGGAESTVLANGIGSLRFGYFGRDPGSADSVPPTWREHWDDPQRLPDLIRVDVTLTNGPAWPTLVVEPKLAPEVGCTTWNPAQRRCM